MVQNSLTGQLLTAVILLKPDGILGTVSLSDPVAQVEPSAAASFASPVHQRGHPLAPIRRPRNPLAPIARTLNPLAPIARLLCLPLARRLVAKRLIKNPGICIPPQNTVSFPQSASTSSAEEGKIRPTLKAWQWTYGRAVATQFSWYDPVYWSSDRTIALVRERVHP